jgi:hypothetical protein
MKKRAALALLAGATTTFYLKAWASLAIDATPPLPGLRAAGQGTLRFWGFDVYSARLWVSPGFQAENYLAQPLALTLAYQRDFSAKSIAERSITEMQRVGDFSTAQAARWRQALQAALPDIQAGDQLTGLYQPGRSAVFQMKGRTVGEVSDPDFSPLFFGIWLSPRTSEPRLREALLALPGSPQ